MAKILRSIFLGVVLLIASACNISSQVTTEVATLRPIVSTTQPGIPSPTPFLPVTDTPVSTPPPQPTPTIRSQISIFLSPALPAKLALDFNTNLSTASGLPEDLSITGQPSENSLVVDVSLPGQNGWDVLQTIPWIYALVAPFPTVLDGVTRNDLLSFWQGENTGPFAGKPILMDAATLESFSALWGKPADQAVKVTPAEGLLDATWNDQPSWAMVPFEDLQPRWKVLTVDDQSPIRKKFDPSTYPLTVNYALEISAQNPASSSNKITIQTLKTLLPATNRDPSRMTVLVMTGVTALTRATAYEMEIQGITFPGKDIVNWLRDADIAHTSNEVSFYSKCPYPDPNQVGLSFCSRPAYFQLLQYVGIDVVELTGNHNNDVHQQYGADAWNPTADLYQQNGMLYFGGGRNLQDAMQAATLENNGNRIAFIGCNSAGPIYAWATTDGPGAAPCQDWSWIKQEISQLKQDGYLVVATVQYDEDYTNKPTYLMGDLFRALADAGADIVDGSQAHTPKSMEFYHNSFIHYGLGNLFFDQMNVLVNGKLAPATRQEFIDQHVIYDGHYISTELLTAMLEDYARPQPMTAEERSAFLQEIFSVPALPTSLPTP